MRGRDKGTKITKNNDREKRKRTEIEDRRKMEITGMGRRRKTMIR